MFQYSQKRVWLNSCVLLSLLTTISNNIRTELFYPDIITCHKTIRRQDAGAIVNIATVSKVVNWFSNHYKKSLTTNELNISTALRHAKIWKYIAVGFRWNEEMFYDITSDGNMTIDLSNPIYSIMQDIQYEMQVNADKISCIVSLIWNNKELLPIYRYKHFQA